MIFRNQNRFTLIGFVEVFPDICPILYKNNPREFVLNAEEERKARKTHINESIGLVLYAIAFVRAGE